MSRNEWEQGTLILPSAEARRVRDMVRQAAETHAEMLYQRGQAFWKGLAPRERRDASAYEEALDRARDRIDEDTALFLGVLGFPKPRCVRRSDLSMAVGKLTGANPTISCGGEARISFVGRRVEWRVPENNHAVERAHEHPIARAFFKALSQVRWTRKTGGNFSGNDEYNRDARDEGSGANYLTASYGPLGSGSGRG